MKISPADAEQYHCPRWDELPAISLYMDQVIIIIEGALCLFEDEKNHVITSSMVNNYVKQRLVPAPEKKKYTKKHIACLIMLSVLKKVLSMQEISQVIALCTDAYGLEAAYNHFCEQLEASICTAFCQSPGQSMPCAGKEGALNAREVMDTALAALTGKLLVAHHLNILAEMGPTPAGTQPT